MCAEVMWELKLFAALTGAELQAIHVARQAVFVVEQNCPYQDADAYDVIAQHLCGWRDGALLAYLRILPPGTKYSEASLGRVLTIAAGRGQGLGKALVAQGIAAVAALYPRVGLRISAQEYLREFYQSFGFEAVSDIYLEDNIPHITMLRSLS